MDWMIFWTAAGVMTLGSLILAGFKAIKIQTMEEFFSLNNRLNLIDQRLSRMEGAFEERGRWESRNAK